MKKIYQAICKVEEWICAAILCGIVALAFATAVARCIGRPISWSVELSQFLLAWLAFLGADMAVRHGSVLGVDLLTRRLPQKTQAIIRLITNALILALLVILVVNGISICKANYKRSFKTVGISYSWATASLPFSAGMMCITMLKNCLDQIQILRGKAIQLKEGECA